MRSGASSGDSRVGRTSRRTGQKTKTQKERSLTPDFGVSDDEIIYVDSD